MKKILRLVGVCCFGAVLVSGDVCGVQQSEKQIELLNPGVMQSALLKLVNEIKGDTNPLSLMEEKTKLQVKSFIKEHSLVFDNGYIFTSNVDEVNEFVLTLFRGAGDLIDSSELGGNSIQILASVCHFIIRELTVFNYESVSLHPNVLVGILEICWRNPELMKIAKLVVDAVEEETGHHGDTIFPKNADFYLAKYLQNLIFEDPDEYDAVIIEWIEKNHSKNWHWKWKDLIELPIFNKPEVIAPLIPSLEGDRLSFGRLRGTEINITSLVEFLNFGHRGFSRFWQSFLNGPECLIELLESGWGNPELMKNARQFMVMIDKEGEGRHPRDSGDEHNDDLYLAKYLRSLILENPSKYDPIVIEWIRRDPSRNWRLKWRSLLGLPIFNEPEIIEPLRAFLRKKYVNWKEQVIPEANDRYANLEYIKEKNALRTKRLNAINNVDSLVKFLGYSSDS
ncbi:MAG: hypothetical protein LBJ96_03620 [Holosporaceae bacterium]|jgi:hypothetical protein|nr:hypothetical protein [Holosporaceae bacterium]